MHVYLVTGGAGFIGSHLCEALINQGNRVINIDNFDPFYDPQIKRSNISQLQDNKNFITKAIDIRDKESLHSVFGKEKVDFVVHLAGMAGVRPSIENPLLYEDVNIRGTLNLLQCMQEFNVKKLVFGSSSSVYGNHNELFKFEEDMPIAKMISPYAITKKAGEDYCFLFHHLYNIDVIALRFFTVYGPGQRPDLAIHKFVKLIDNKMPIPFYGDGSSMRDYSYVTDIVAGVTQALSYLKSNMNIFEIINLSGNKAVSLKSLLEIIEEAVNKKAIINWLPMQAGDVMTTNASIEKAQRLLNYQPKIKIEDGIQSFVNWYKSFNNSN